ncbi:hypothetical protein D3870_18990 [Noviherbaspirillum cavernae]|uniref:Bacterial transcriptional activator domain-containing protein n=1 Tax=Noviherbaspirillum cavernae TaxID=2320862 RepID=A0A418WUZ5_9BURK|nr:BTAD domain-containing putative transcriptional regulator [Noviherbaspirillum cavernae]RJF96534.1 hypothetical protein D3870_18990 [Noviherbaspirillum cavernae]
MLPDRSPTYAKLSPPRVHEAVPRTRLFARLDALCKTHAVIWLAAPPGAGKTTLAASYLAAAQVPSVWCQIDQGDADPASFFFFLSEAVRGAGPALPWLAPELEGNVVRIARLFFRDFYARLPRGAVVVFDNIQEFDWSNSGELMEIAFSEIPYGVTVLALSRDAPPARLARLEVHGLLVTLDWNELRLNADEARALMQLDDIDCPHRQVWLDKIDGWAAGIVMLREHLAEHLGQTDVPLLEGREAVFRYFAGEILERMPSAWQHSLLLLSSLPGISPSDAQLLTGDSAASGILSQLFQHRLFVDRRGPAPYTYHFHALFREFLQYEARQRLDADERAALLERAATIADTQGRTDEAARLYHEARAWPQLARLLLHRASDMLTTGRGQTWREWLHWLPPAMVEAEPWLRHWQGASLNHVDPALGRQFLVQAEQAFHAGGDVRARLLTVAAIIDSYTYEWAGFSALREWAEVMLDGLAQLDPATLDPLTDLRIHSRLTLALFFTAPDSPALARSAERALKAISLVDDRTEQLAAGTFLLDYFSTTDIVAARELTASLDRHADDPAIGPFHRIWWYRSASFRHQLDSNYPAAETMVANARRLATEFGLDHLLIHFNLRAAIGLLGAGDLAATAALLGDLRRSLPSARKLDLVYLRSIEACYLAQCGDIRAALPLAQTALDLATDAAVSPTTRCQLHVSLACCHVQAGDYAAAEQQCAEAVADMHGYNKDYARNAQLFVRACASLFRNDEAQAAEILRQLFAELRRPDATLSVTFASYPHLARSLFALALREGIEVDYVRGLIARQKLAAPDRVTPDWPWPVVVRCLGKFELSLAGGGVAASGKAQQRPLMLLKALLASGDAGQLQQSLAVRLWPDASDPKAALNINVHRLRKLLDNDEAVVVAAGKIMLAETRVWSDVAALIEICEQCGRLDDGTSGHVVNRLASMLLNLYRGPFCDGEEDSWLLPARERLRGRFLAAVEQLGQRLEQAREWALAHRLYLRAQEAEPLAETVYRGLMRCAHAQNDPAAAFSTYRRCRDTLSIVLGRKPSAETEHLAAVLDLK